MNSINLFKYPRFPLSSETLDFLQQMALLMSKASGIGGDNYILSGCAETGTNVAAGIIVISGEVMPFTGGTKESYIVIEEIKRSVTAEGQVYQDVYTTRQARFGIGSGQLEWNLFKPVSLKAIEAKVDALVPTGIVVMWSGVVAPAGWHLCDGTDGSPDLRDRFVLSAGTVLPGVYGGNREITLNPDQLPAHKHGAGTLSLDDPTLANYLSYNNNTLSLADSISAGVQQKTIAITGETAAAGLGNAITIMPPYYTLAYIIKV